MKNSFRKLISFLKKFDACQQFNQKQMFQDNNSAIFLKSYILDKFKD